MISKSKYSVITSVLNENKLYSMYALFLSLFTLKQWLTNNNGKYFQNDYGLSMCVG